MSDFKRDLEFYQRDYNCIAAYKKQVIKALTIRYGITDEDAATYVNNVLSNEGKFPLKDPKVVYVGKDTNGDRVEKETTLLSYLSNVQSNGLIMSPSMNVYIPKDKKLSIQSLYIAEGKKKRSEYKDMMYAGEREGDVNKTIIGNKMQGNKKINNNSLSGAAASRSTILFMKSIHNSLTSMCRSASGYANSNNEKIVSGNRHYNSPEDTLSNIIYIVTMFDRDEFAEILETYNLYIPNTDDVMECITRSTSHYWRDERIVQIAEVVDRMSPLEKAAVLYINDFYHLAKHNREFIVKMVEDVTEWEDVEEMVDGEPINGKHIISKLRSMPEEVTAMVGLLTSDLIKSVNDIKSSEKAVQKDINIINSCIINVVDNTPKYSKLFTGIFASKVRIAGVATLKNIRRMCAITSDTDSTIYTTESWHKWYTDNTNEVKNYKISYFINMIISSSVVHILAQLSANVGIARDEIFGYMMKSEFFFPSFVITPRTKTYTADQAVKEGVVFRPSKTEIKGAVFKGSTNSQEIMEDSNNMIRDILNKVKNNGAIDVIEYVRRVAELEHKLLIAVESGDHKFFKRLNIKDPDSYGVKDPYKNNYFSHILWTEVFADKYGGEPHVPYDALRISLDLSSVTKFKRWVDSFDTIMKEKLNALLIKANKKSLGTISIPLSVLRDLGSLPEEIRSVMASRKIVYQIMEQHYVQLESLGHYSLTKEPNRMCMDLL